MGKTFIVDCLYYFNFTVNYLSEKEGLRHSITIFVNIDNSYKKSITS